MSPEQAEGKKVNAQSDIFSFGSLLYEMVAGRRPFQGDTRMSTLTAILREEPKPLSEIAETVPRDLEKIITRCLRKDLERRFQHADDLRVALQELREESESGKLGAAPLAQTRQRWQTAALAASLAALAVPGFLWWKNRPEAPAKGPVLTRITSDAGLTTGPAISADGKLLSYASDRGGEGNLEIWVQQIGGGEPARITRHEADDREPTFSPDGTRIAFRSERDGGGIYVVSTLGGEARRLVREGRAPKYSPDGNWIAYRVGSNWLDQHFIMPASGGAPQEVLSGFLFPTNPVWSPDGKHLLFRGYQDADALAKNAPDWFVLAVEGRAVAPTRAVPALRQHGLPTSSPDQWLGDYVYFSASVGDSSSLWRIAVSPRTRQVTGAPQRLTFGTSQEAQPSVAPGPGGLLRVVFASGAPASGLWSLSIEPSQGKVTGELKQLTRTATRHTYPSASADGKKVVFGSHGTSNSDIWLKELSSSRETALTTTTVYEIMPKISPDGSKVAYMVREQGKRAIYVLATDGGAPEKVCDDCGRPAQWSPDGEKIVFDFAGTLPNQWVGFLNLATRQKTEVLKHAKHTAVAARLSPDYHWITFITFTGLPTRTVYVAPFREGAPIPENEWVPITDGKGLEREPFWSPDGNLVYYLGERDGFRCIWAQSLDAATKRPSGSAFPVAHFHSARRSLMHFEDVGQIGLTVLRDQLIFSLAEATGNIWMAEISGR